MQSFSKWLVLAEYKLNRDFISKNLCENKSAPSKHCNGHCHLMKQLQKDNERDDNSSTGIKSKTETTLFSSKFENKLIVFRSEKTFSHPQLNITISTVELSSVFHPPCLT